MRHGRDRQYGQLTDTSQELQRNQRAAAHSAKSTVILTNWCHHAHLLSPKLRRSERACRVLAGTAAPADTNSGHLPRPQEICTLASIHGPLGGKNFVLGCVLRCSGAPLARYLRDSDCVDPSFPCLLSTEFFLAVSVAMEAVLAPAEAPVQLDPAQQAAIDSFESGLNVALLGRAGSGKSEVLRRMIASASAKWSRDEVAVTALSGSAALVVGGQTLHSLFGMDTRPLSRDAWLRITLTRHSVCARLNALRVLFIDEICTVPSSLFDRLSYVMRRVGPPYMQNLSFAGCQVVGMSVLRALLFGDGMSGPRPPRRA